jgi:type I restriction enzyme S subunit
MEKELPKNWVETSPKNISEIIRGVSYSKDDAFQEEFENSCLILRGGNVQDGNVVEGKDNVYVDFKYIKKEQLVRESDVLIVGSTGSKQLIGKAATIREDNELISFGAFLMILRAHKKINGWYFSYYFQTDFYRESIRNLAGGVNINNIRKEYIENLAFPLPPLTEQNRIVAKLDSLFAQLESIKTSMSKIPVLLKSFRQQVLTQAVTGKLTEEWREGKDLRNISNRQIAGTLDFEVRELNGNNISCGRSKIKINPINFVRKNEINWSYYTVESLSIAIVDCLHETAKFSQSGYKIIDTNNINAFKINELKLRFVEDDIYKKWTSRLKPEYGDIVFTREGTIGNALMIPENDKYCIGQRTMIFRFTNLLEPRFCEYYLNSEPFKRQYKPFIKGVASQHLNIRDLRLLEMPIPSISEQKEIVFRVESLFAKADAIEEKYKNLKAKIETLPQTILHKSFKGELTEQLETDGDAKVLLGEIVALKNGGNLKKINTKNYF